MRFVSPAIDAVCRGLYDAEFPAGPLIAKDWWRDPDGTNALIVDFNFYREHWCLQAWADTSLTNVLCGLATQKTWTWPLSMAIMVMALLICRTK